MCEGGGVALQEAGDCCAVRDQLFGFLERWYDPERGGRGDVRRADMREMREWAPLEFGASGFAEKRRRRPGRSDGLGNRRKRRGVVERSIGRSFDFIVTRTLGALEQLEFGAADAGDVIFVN